MTSKEKQDIAYFLSFCIEQYKAEKEMSGEAIADLFAKNGVLEYLQECFDVLHTQSRQWIMADIDEFIDKRRR